MVEVLTKTSSQIIAVFHALSEPLRIQTIEHLQQRELCVCELCELLSISQSKLSFHLKVLKSAGLVHTRQEGRWIYYRLAREVKRPIDAIYASFEDIESNPRIARDRERIGRRLKLRDDGQCIRGFDQLNTRSKRKAA